jgi:ectoine hydroxylase
LVVSALKAGDPYPTRIGRPAELLPRKEPVVWPTNESATADTLPYETRTVGATRALLDDAQLERFDTDGYVTVEAVFSDAEVARLDAALADMVAATEVDGDRLIVEPGSDDLRSIFDIHRQPGPLADAVASDQLAGVARQLLADDVYVHQSRANRKPAFTGREFQWHSDFETWHAEDGMPRMRALSASVALTDNHPWNGPLLVMPGSHQWFVTCPEPTPPANHEQSLAKQEIGVPDEAHLSELHERFGIEMCTGKAGSVTFFDCNLMHGSPSNISPAPRRNLFVVFNSVDNAISDPFSAPQQRPLHIASRRFSPV